MEICSIHVIHIEVNSFIAGVVLIFSQHLCVLNKVFLSLFLSPHFQVSQTFFSSSLLYNFKNLFLRFFLSSARIMQETFHEFCRMKLFFCSFNHCSYDIFCYLQLRVSATSICCNTKIYLQLHTNNLNSHCISLHNVCLPSREE